MSPFAKDSAAEGLEYGRGGVGIAQHKNGNIVCGTTREFAGYDRGTTYEGVLSLARGLVRIFPGLKQTHVIRTFAGLRPFSPDGLPIISSVARPEGFFIASGHEGDGIALAPITGQLIEQLISGKISPEVLSSLDYSRFRNRK
ncbi:MAG: FAD-dependent oxidoreductase [Deltaproteobacteria bacterium]|nr:FAD-dependent oxidoreductase [Deltaproteobacteria bacterium]